MPAKSSPKRKKRSAGTRASQKRKMQERWLTRLMTEGKIAEANAYQRKHRLGLLGGEVVRMQLSKEVIAASPGTEPVKPLPGSLPEIDYDKLAEAMLRAQRKEEERGEKLHRAFQRGGPDAVEDLRAKLDTDLVVPSNNPVTRILSQLSYPKDKEGQVVAMIAANMAPSVNPGDPEGELQAALQERVVLAHMKEYVMTLRPELPKTRLEPKYTLNGVAAEV